MSEKGLRDRIKVFPKTRAEQSSTLGIALSGGGSRAIAFHLGCFRALHDMEMLDKINHISSVSGGSLFSALYSYYEEPFESFDDRVTSILRKGLDAKIVYRLFLSSLLIKVLGTQLVAGMASNLSRILGNDPPLKRWFSLTNAFINVLENDLFPGLSLTSKTKNDIDIIINACELSTGSAFRFGNRESGSWRMGKLQDNNIPLSEAVACSAAYPLLLPNLDKDYVFMKSGKAEQERAFLTDGGVYDNTGVTCFDPDKSSAYSYNLFKPDYIFAFDAGHGIYGKPTYPFYFKSRVENSYNTTFRKAQDAIKDKLHTLQASGKISGFIYSYLGQNDYSLPYLPIDLIKNSQVVGYPTDFKAMRKEDLVLIAGRGEQLTRLLVSYYDSKI